MGRRKIEIRPISDDRNRSVTFLKRKGGLFKKAHELSVLCSVDVAVIIFGHNKKLYEFSSGDIQETIGRYQYYGGPHEHKGPDDFKDKNGGDDDDDEEDIEQPLRESRSPPQPMMAHHLQNQPAFQHIGTPSQSPPMPNGGFHRPQHPQHRGPSPQPPQNISRPGSRAHIRHPSHLGPPQPQHLQVSQGPPPHAQPNYAYMPNPPIYNPQTAAGMQMRPQPGQPHPPQFQYPQPPTTHPQQHPPQHAQVQQVQQQFQQDQRRQTAPPGYPQQQQHQQHPQHPQDQRSQPPPQPSPQPHQAQFHSPPMPQPKPLPASKTHSIFTPIDDSRSLLAQHWGSTSNADQPTSEPPVKVETGPRSQSIDIASINRKQPNGINGSGPQQQQAEQSNPPSQGPAPPMRTASTPVIPSIHPPIPPSRTNSMQADPRRPRLKVQIPDDEEEGQRTAMESSPQATAAAQRTPIREHTGVVLPPPSPSAGSLLSAGATGPPNPFARPPIPPVNGGFGSRNDLETPISALPSRFVSDNLLPSPSSFYADWAGDFGRGSNNMLPSPLTFQTPVAANGPSFKDDDTDKKRKQESSEDAPGKRLKT